MKKKGFTLIELLAVIVILAIIALIITPVIKDLIESSRYASAVDSVLSYVAGANTQAAADVGIGGFEGFSLDLSNNNRLETGITDDELAKIKFKGKGPTYVYLHFTDDSKLVSDGHFCIWNYSIDYRMDTGASKSVGNNYCTGEIIVKEHYDIGEPIYYNVTTGKQCSEDAFLANVDEWGSHANFTYIDGKLITRSLEAMPTGLHSGCMKFYTLKDDGDNLTVIAASNIDEVGPDKYETDPNKFGERYVLWADIKTGAENQNVKDFNNITNSQSNTLYVLDTLNNELNENKIPQKNEKIINPIRNYNVQDANGIVKFFNENHNTLIGDLFNGLKSTDYICDTCSNVVKNYQIFNIITCSIEKTFMDKYGNKQKLEKDSKVDILDCFKLEEKPNLFVGNNQIFCGQCNTSRDGKSINKICISPKIMILFLDRGLNNRFMCDVDFPEELDINNFLETKGNKYKLIGVIEHLGQSGESGHFIANCKHFNGEWYIFSDSSIHPTQKEYKQYGVPYLLFYRRED